LHFCFPLLSSLPYAWPSLKYTFTELGLLYTVKNILVWMPCQPSFCLWLSMNAWNFRWIFYKFSMWDVGLIQISTILTSNTRKS
jgi:hypothetical protein